MPPPARAGLHAAGGQAAGARAGARPGPAAAAAAGHGPHGQPSGGSAGGHNASGGGGSAGGVRAGGGGSAGGGSAGARAAEVHERTRALAEDHLLAVEDRFREMCAELQDPGSPSRATLALRDAMDTVTEALPYARGLDDVPRLRNAITGLPEWLRRPALNALEARQRQYLNEAVAYGMSQSQSLGRTGTSSKRGREEGEGSQGGGRGAAGRRPRREGKEGTGDNTSSSGVQIVERVGPRSSHGGAGGASGGSAGAAGAAAGARRGVAGLRRSERFGQRTEEEEIGRAHV